MYPRRYYPRVGLSRKTSADEEKSMSNLLLDQEKPIWQRFRAFSSLLLDVPVFRAALTKALWDDSSLLAYDAASELLILQDVGSIPAWKRVLADLSLHPIVRQKAAEALGAFGLESNAPALKDGLALDPAQEVRETCEVALRRIEDVKNRPTSSSPIGPAPCASVPVLREVLFCEEGKSTVYDRVGAVINLAKIRASQKKGEVLSAIIEARVAKSVLVRYWVARILSGRKNEKVVEVLSECLRDSHENPFVRQEAAKGLGFLAASGVLADSCIFTLREFARDPEPTVAQRCQVTLKKFEIEKSGEHFELAMQSYKRLLSPKEC